jgi:hypothetical protein
MAWGKPLAMTPTWFFDLWHLAMRKDIIPNEADSLP